MAVGVNVFCCSVFACGDAACNMSESRLWLVAPVDTPRLGTRSALAAAPAERTTGDPMHYDATSPAWVGRIQRCRTICSLSTASQYLRQRPRNDASAHGGAGGLRVYTWLCSAGTAPHVLRMHQPHRDISSSYVCQTWPANARIVLLLSVILQLLDPVPIDVDCPVHFVVQHPPHRP